MTYESRSSSFPRCGTRIRSIIASACALVLSIGAAFSIDAITAPVYATTTPACAPGTTATPWIMNDAEYQYVQTGYSGIVSVDILDLNPASSSLKKGVTGVGYYKSYAKFAADVNSGAILSSTTPWVAYDNENWQGTQLGDTPGTRPSVTLSGAYTGGVGELGDPTASMAGFIELAHTFGFNVIVMPAQDLLPEFDLKTEDNASYIGHFVNDTWPQLLSPAGLTGFTGYIQGNAPWPIEMGQTLSEVAATADIYEIQAQPYELQQWRENDTTDLPTSPVLPYYETILQQAGQQAQSAPGSIASIYAGISTARVEASGSLTAWGEMNVDYMGAIALGNQVSGFWLNIPPATEVASPPGPTGPKIAENFLSNYATNPTACALPAHTW